MIPFSRLPSKTGSFLVEELPRGLVAASVAAGLFLPLPLPPYTTTPKIESLAPGGRRVFRAEIGE